MKSSFNDGADIHTLTASRIYHESIENVTANQRRNAKTANFGILYGISYTYAEKDLTAIEMETPISEAVDLAISDGYSRMPVYEETIDNIKGLIFAKDLLSLIGDTNLESRKVADFIRPVNFIPESNSCSDVFMEFQQKKIQAAIVVDEYGGTAGIVTLEDVLESIVGNIQDEYDDEEEEITQINDTTFTIEGTTDLDEVNELVGIELPDGDYDTLGGFVISLLGYLPGEITDEPIVAEYENLRFTVLSIDERRIDEIKVEILPEPETDEEDDED